MFTVQRFRGGYAIVYQLDGKRVRRTLTATDRQSAEAEARSLWSGANKSPWTVGRIMTEYLASIAHKPSHGRRQDAWKAMRHFWERVDPALIDEPMAKAYRTSRTVADATARYELLQLSTALGWAGDRIPRRPKVWLPQTPERKTRHLTRPEFSRFEKSVIADHAQLYVAIGLYTCARPTAILELTWDRVDFMRRQIDFTPPGHVRTAKRRTVVPIGDALLPKLQAGYSGRTSPHVIERGGKPVACIKKAFQAASARCGLHVTPYTLRHTGAVWAAEGGISMDELSQFLGHDTAATTSKFYARYSPGFLVKVANAIGA